MSLIDEVFEKAGGRQVLQEKLHLSKQTMSDWKRWGRVPANHAVAVENLTGIPREKLCPQFEWGRNQEQAQASKPNAPSPKSLKKKHGAH